MCPMFHHGRQGKEPSSHKSPTKSLIIELGNALRAEIPNCTISNEAQLLSLNSNLRKGPNGARLLTHYLIVSIDSSVSHLWN